ncbi:hypothetical protein [Streptomyces sp. NPDC020917]|uniref:hypothetical protein n=1 Tax=Streptomyces sp. NPDC020917 TaxID=3365102 RepID=UPI0037B1C9AA
MDRSGTDDFADRLVERVLQAREALRDAAEARDAAAVARALDELNGALRLARAHGIPVPGTAGVPEGDAGTSEQVGR